MKFFLNSPIIERTRKPDDNFYNYLRLNRAEYGHSFNSKIKKENHYYYYPSSLNLIKNLSKYLKVKIDILLIGLGAESLIRDALYFFSKSKNRIGYLAPNYFMYNIYAKFYGYQLFELNINPENSKEMTVKTLFNFIEKKKYKYSLVGKSITSF